MSLGRPALVESRIMARGSLIRSAACHGGQGGDDLQALDDLLAALGRQGLVPVGGVDHLAELDLLGVEVDPVDENVRMVSAPMPPSK